MDEMLTPEVAASWRESLVIPSRPCPVTKKTDKIHLQWGLPEEETEWVEEESKELNICSVAEASSEDAQLLTQHFTPGGNRDAAGAAQSPSSPLSTSASSTGVGSSNSALEEWNTKVATFSDSRRQVHQTFVEMLMEISEVVSKMVADNNKYTKEILVDIKKFKDKV